jgi:hypothetical protein
MMRFYPRSDYADYLKQAEAAWVGAQQLLAPRDPSLKNNK